MPNNLLALLQALGKGKSKSKQDAITDLLKKYTSGGLMDSLSVLANGRPDSVKFLPQGTNPNLYGVYNSQNNDIALNRLMFGDHYTNTQKDRTLMHEMGHKLDRTAPESNVPYHQLDNMIFSQFGKQVAPLEDSTKPADQAQLDYLFSRGVTNNKELGAEAFASAVTFMRRHSESNPEMSEIMNDLLEREKEMPGTSATVNYLMQQPLYQKHPVVKFFKTNDILKHMPAMTQDNTKVKP